jgi:signal transduction histidine kinase
MRSRLFLQIYFGFLAIALVFSLAAFSFRLLEMRERPLPPIVTALAQRIAEELPEAGASDAETAAAIAGLAQKYGVDATLWAAGGQALAWSGERLDGRAWRHGVGNEVRLSRHGVSLKLADGRRLGLRPHFERDHPGGALAGLLLLNLVIAGVAWPVSRRMTRRLERLRAAVDELGSGDLSARVPVEGRDEIADVARSFNVAAVRIERLITAQRRVLASASHELRSPLTRLRMALELLGREDRTELIAAAERDIEELDALIGDVLESSRLEAGQGPRGGEPVDVLALVAQVAADTGVAASGAAVTIHGQPRLLQRLVRNLIDNARRHGGGDVDIHVEALPDGDGARICVGDRGAGVSEAERARIFEPFYRPPNHSEGRDGGVGLGLALVREIARHHGGDAHCRARTGGGTLFEVDLRGCPEADSADRRSAGRGPAGGASIRG